MDALPIVYKFNLPPNHPSWSYANDPTKYKHKRPSNPPWHYEGEFPTDTAPYAGFIYKIEHKTLGKYYLGSKQFHRGTYRTHPSDWQNYWGSSRVLDAAIATYGYDAFQRTIIRLVKSLSHLNLEERVCIMKHAKRDRSRLYNIRVQIHKGWKDLDEFKGGVS